MYCNNCGTLNSDNASHCTNCGAQLTNTVQDFDRTTVITPEEQEVAYQPANEQPTYEQPAYEQPAYEQPAYEQPAYEQPAYEQPAYEQPVEEPAYEAPANEQPAEVVASEKDPGKGLGIASLILGILSLSCCCGGIVVPIVGMILGIKGFNKSADAGYENKMAKIGKILSIIGLVVGILAIIGVAASSIIGMMSGGYNY